MRYFGCIILMLICYGANAQPVEELWARTYSGDLYGSFECMIQTSDGGYAVGGRKENAGPGQNDFWMMKLNPAGNSEWIRYYGTDSLDVLDDLIELDDGYVLAGLSEGYPPAEEAALLIRLDANGDSVGSFVFDDYLFNHFHKITKTLDGGVFAVGDVTDNPNREEDWLLLGAKLSTDLELDWSHRYLSGYNCWGYELVATADGGYALGCNPEGTSGLLRIDANGIQGWFSQVGQPGTVVELSDGGFAGLVSSPGFSTIRFVDSDGILEDTKSYDYGYSDDGAYPPYVFMERFRNEGLVFPVDLGELSDEPGKFALARMDTAGDSLWISDSFIRSWDSSIRDLIQIEDGGFALCGEGSVPGQGLANWIFRTTPDGSIIATHSLTLIREGDGVRLRWSVNPELAGVVEGFRIYGTTDLNVPYESYLGYSTDTTFVHESSLAESDLFYYFIVSTFGFAEAATEQQDRGEQDGYSAGMRRDRHLYHR